MTMALYKLRRKTSRDTLMDVRLDDRLVAEVIIVALSRRSQDQSYENVARDTRILMDLYDFKPSMLMRDLSQEQRLSLVAALAPAGQAGRPRAAH